MKAYTDIEQSKKLAEILPIESADMLFERHYGETTVTVKPWTTKGKSIGAHVLPCWSLTTLLNVLPSSTLDSSDDHYYRVRCKERFTEWYDNAVDACYEMIVKLREQMIEDFNKKE